MSEARSRVLQWSAFLVLGVGAAWHLWRGARVEVDDVYIVLRAAENFAEGHGPVFTPGDTFVPVTCPLWTVLLGAVRLLSPQGDLVELARTISIVFTVAATMLLFALLRRPLGWFAIALGPLLLFAKEVPEHVGNEVGMASCFAAATILAAQGGRMTLAAAGAALFYLTRGEGVLLAALVFAPGAWSAWRRGVLGAHLRTLVVPALVFLAIVANWHVYHLVQFGSVMPKTLAVKMLQGSSGLWTKFGSRLLDNQWAYLKHGVVLGPLFVIGLLLLSRTVWLLPAWAGLHVAAYSALRVPNYDWYYYPLFVLTPVAVLAGIAQAHRWAAARVTARWPALVAATGVLALLYVWTPRNVPSANGERVDQYRLVAAWLERHAASTPRPLALAFEIGIIGYYARAVPFVDPPGILVPDLTVELLRDWHELVRRRQPEIMIFREDLGERFTIADTARGTEHRYALAIKLPAQSFPQHVYRRLP